jgi:hypothetical protein
MDAAYFQAAIPEPYIIFGLRLLPLSIGRYRILKRFDCGFTADDERTATMADLILGIVVCSMRCDEFFSLMESPEFGTELKRLGQRIRDEITADKCFSLLEKYGLFQSYIMASTKIPEYFDEMDERPESFAHWSHNLEISLRSELNYSDEQINEGPISKALYDFLKHAENQGSIRIVTDAEIDQGKANEALFLKMMKGAQCQGSN